MSSKKPQVQVAWKEFKERNEEQLNLLNIKEIAFKTCELIWWLVPYILASWQMNIMTPPRKHSHGRRIHRNI